MLDELEELLGLPFGFADDEDVRVDLVVALVQFVEEHGSTPSLRSVRGRQYTPGGAMARPRVEVVHVGSACRDVVPRRTRAAGGSAAASRTPR